MSSLPGWPHPSIVAASRVLVLDVWMDGERDLLKGRDGLVGLVG